MLRWKKTEAGNYYRIEIPYTQLTNLNIQQKLQDTGVLK